MLRKATKALAAVLFFGTASVVWADANNQIDGLFAQRPVAIVSNGHTAANETAKPFTTEDRPSLAASQLAPARGGTTGRTTAWIKLTEPGGKPIHINAEHVTSVRSDTQIPGARAQLELTSGKFQGVQENVEQVMQLISATPGARENDETPSAPYDQAERPRFSNELSLQTPHLEFSLLPARDTIPGARNRIGKRHMKFVLVNGRTPRPQSFCALCCEAIGESYLRELTTRLSYCDHKCYAGHCKIAVRALQRPAKAS